MGVAWVLGKEIQRSAHLIVSTSDAPVKDKQSWKVLHYFVIFWLGVLHLFS